MTRLSYPPHLPPPAQSIEAHKKWQRIKLLVVVVAVGVAAGAAGAALLLSWVWPEIGLTTTLSPFVSTDHDVAPAPATPGDVESKIVSIYGETIAAGQLEIAAPDYRVGYGLIVSSDGWVVLLSDHLPATPLPRWRAVGSGGVVYSFVRRVADPYTGLVYLKIKETLADERVATLRDPQPGMAVMVGIPGFWHSARLWGYAPWKADSALDVLPRGLTIYPAGAAGSLVVTPEGQVLGLVAAAGAVLPALAASNQFGSVFERGQIQYRSLGVTGWWSADSPVIRGRSVQEGFYVDTVLPGSRLQHGDIITALAGGVVAPDQSWYTTLRSATIVPVTVLRQKQILVLPVKILDLP